MLQRLLLRLRGNQATDSAAARRRLGALLARVGRLEDEAQWTNAVARARAWKEIAECASEAGEGAQAKEAYGRALDAYIEGGCYDAAAALCRRFLDEFPSVVRAHCTLALLYIARRDLGDAVAAIRAYAQAAHRTGTESVATARLTLVAQLAGGGDVREAAVQAIRDLTSPGVWRTLMRYVARREGADASEPQAIMSPLDLALLNQAQVRERMIEIGGTSPAATTPRVGRTTSAGSADLPLLGSRDR